MPFLTFLHAAGLPEFAASALLRRSHRLNILSERNVAAVQSWLERGRQNRRFASSSLLQVKVGLAGAMDIGRLMSPVSASARVCCEHGKQLGKWRWLIGSYRAEFSLL